MYGLSHKSYFKTFDYSTTNSNTNQCEGKGLLEGFGRVEKVLLFSLKSQFTANYGRVFFVRLLCLGSSTVEVGEGGASGIMTAAASTLTSKSFVSS